MNRQQHHDALQTLMLEQQLTTAALNTCLEQEREALTTMDGTQLEMLAQEKNSLLQTLEQQSKQRISHAQTAGFGDQPEEIHAYITWADQKGILISAWQEQLKNLQACQHQNRVNGGAIELSRQQLGAILGVLRGEEKTGNPTYEANGKAASKLGNRNLGSA